MTKPLSISDLQELRQKLLQLPDSWAIDATVAVEELIGLLEDPDAVCRRLREQTIRQIDYSNSVHRDISDTIVRNLRNDDDLISGILDRVDPYQHPIEQIVSMCVLAQKLRIGTLESAMADILSDCCTPINSTNIARGVLDGIMDKVWQQVPRLLDEVPTDAKREASTQQGS